MDLRERKREIARRQIVDAAFELFTTHGFEDTTVEMIAEKAVVSPRTIYRYFESKEWIVFAGFAGEFDWILEAVADRCATGVSVHGLFAAFAEQLGRRQHQPPFRTITALMRDNPPLMARGDGWLRELMRRLAEFLAERRGSRDVSLEDRALAGMVVAVTETAVTHWAANDHQGDLGEMILRAGRAVLDGREG